MGGGIGTPSTDYESTGRFDKGLTTRFYRSFSGTDALVFMLLPQSEPVLLGSLSTISYSMSRDKRPVSVIGQINVGGFTRGTRIYAGTMIFTMINQHWVNDLRESAKWLKNLNVTKVDELPLFDLMIVCANEYGSAINMFIYGVDMTDEGQVISVEDLFTENTFNFVARDMDNFSNEFTTKNGTTRILPIIRENNFLVMPDGTVQQDTRPRVSSRLYYDPSDMVVGADVADVQQKLNNVEATRSWDKLPLTGRYDYETYRAVRHFQAKFGLTITGEVDDETYLALESQPLDNVNPTALVKSIHGAYIREDKTFKSKVVKHYPYETTLYYHKLEEASDWLETAQGYLHINDVETHLLDMTKVFEVVSIYQQQPDVISELSILFELDWTNEWTYELSDALFEFQQAYELPPTGYLSEITYKALQELKGFGDYDDVLYHDVSTVVLRSTPGAFDAPFPTIRLAGVYYVAEAITKPGSYAIKRSPLPAPQNTVGLIQDLPYDSLARFGIILTTYDDEVAVKTNVVAFYPNNQSKGFDYAYTVAANREIFISADDHSEFLLYDLETQAEPVGFDFIVNVENTGIYKWRITFKED